MQPSARIAIQSTSAPSPGEIADMANVWIDTWSQTMPAIDFSARRAWFVDRADASPLTLLARDTNKDLLGFMLLDPATGYMDQLAVAPASKGSGTATTLLNTAKQTCSLICLDVNEDNPRAVRFYQREGFVITGHGKNQLSGLKTITMRWNADQHTNQ